MAGKEEKERAARNCPELARIAQRPLEAELDNSWKVSPLHESKAQAATHPASEILSSTRSYTLTSPSKMAT